MQRLKTTHISPAEWRWVFIFGGVLAAVTLLPYAWALGANASATEWQFMGILANPQDGATYLAKIEQGMHGAWLINFMHTPETHAGAGIQILYPLLGHLARLFGISSLVMFHLARVVTTLFMFSSIYQLGAAIWSRQRPRRLFFMLASLGSGLGWLVLLLAPQLTDVPDLVVPEAYPLYAAFTNPHFPLAIGALALIAANYLDAFAVDAHEEPTIANGGLSVFVLSLVVALVLPQGLVPIGAALASYLVVQAVRQKTLPVMELRWTAMLFLPAALMAAYYYAVVTYNPVMQAWNFQISNPTAMPGLVLAGYGLLLFVALPGLIRGVRHFEQDSDQLMLLWLVVNFILVFLPFNHQRRFMIGLIMPVVFFAVRSLEDFWLPRIHLRFHSVAIVLLVVLILPSNVLALGIPLFGLIDSEAGLEQKLLIQDDYWQAMTWLNAQGNDKDVVLAGPNPSLWIPVYSYKHVVYGHPYETIQAPQRLRQVTDWFDGNDCYWPQDSRDGYHIRYVMYGPQERPVDPQSEGADCEAVFAPYVTDTMQFGDVTLYVVADQGD